MKKIAQTICATFIGFSLMACEANTSAHIDSQAIQVQLTNKEALLIDVRTQSEYNAGHVAASVLAPYDSIAQTIGTLAPNKNQKVYLYCRSGSRASAALNTLKGMGYTDVTNLGGLNDLTQYGLSIGQ